MKAGDLQEALYLHKEYLDLLSQYDLIASNIDGFEITIRGKYQTAEFKSRVKSAVLFSLMKSMSDLKRRLSQLGVEV